jgi:rare lipoprotein A
VPAASVATTAVAATGSDERWRYRVADGKATGNADNFDAWMKAQGVHVATGQPATVASSASAPSTPSRAAVVAAASAPVVTLAVADDKPVVKVEPVVDEAKPSMAEAALGNILLQVASFASRENANRALAQLASAGIVGASISDIAAGGRTMWRLRVNARDHASASELASRIAGLGFGQPQIVTR